MPLFGPQSKDDAPSKSRRRALTAPLDKPARIWLHRQKTHVQTQSSLLYRLPLEVRELIYAYSFGWPDQDDADLLRGQARQKIHVFANKFGHLSCGACMSVSPECTTRCYKPSRWGQPTGDFLNILLSCRQIYSETVDILYSLSIFVFGDMSSFLSFTRRLPPRRLCATQAIHLEWHFLDYQEGGHRLATYYEVRPIDQGWKTAIDVLASMSLQVLHLRFIRDRGWQGPKWDDEIFKDLARIRDKVAEMKVEANWEAKESHRDAFNVSFTDRRYLTY